MKRSLIKVCVASLALACGGLATSLSGCSDSATTDGGTEAGGQDTSMADTGVVDTGKMETSTDSGVSAFSKLIVVHASPELWGIRICFAANGTLTPLPALPHDPATQPASLGFPGIPPGAGGPFPSTGTDITPLTITPYVMVANSIKTFVKGQMGGETKCSDMLNPDGGTLVSGTDYFKLTDIPANTLKHDKTYLLALVGCSKNAAALGAANKCGPGWNNNTGNLEVKIIELDRTTAMGKVGAQYIDLTPSPHPVNNLAVVGSFIETDGGATQVINAAPVPYLSLSPINQVANPPSQTAVLNSTLIGPADASTQVPIPLTNVHALTGGMGAHPYVAGQGFTFVLVGDITRSPDGGAGNGMPNQGYTLHPLGFSNDPVIPPLN